LYSYENRSGIERAKMFIYSPGLFRGATKGLPRQADGLAGLEVARVDTGV
jgi:hypothetical protein